MFPFYTGSLRIWVADSCEGVAVELSENGRGERADLDVATLSLESWTDRSSDREEPDCLVVPADPGPEGDLGVDGVVAEAPAGVPVVVVVDGGSHDAVADALEAGAAETLPRGLFEADPDTGAERVRSVVERERTRIGYREVYDRVAGTVSVHDPETGELVHANESLCDLLGYDRETLLSMTVGDFTADVEGYDHERATRLVRSTAETGDPVEIEWPLVTAAGEVRWVDSCLERLSIGGRELVLSVSADITERRRRERAYERVFDSVNDAISVHDPWAEAMIDVNDAMCELTGIGEDALLEMDVAGASTDGESESDRIYGIQQRVAATGDPETVEWEVRTAAGETRVLESKLTPATLGGEDRVLALSRDVTERRADRRRLRAERDRRSVLFENNPDPVVRVEFEDDEPFIREVNPAFEEVFGFGASEAVGSTVEEVLVPEDEREDHRRARERAVEGEPVEREVPRLTADGIREFRFRVIHFSADPDDDVSEAYVWYTDVTERGRRERAISALQDATERMHEAETAEAVAETAVEAAREALDLPTTMCWFHDADAGRLEPVVATDEVHEAGLWSPLGSDRYEYDVFEDGEVTTYSPREHAEHNPLETAVLLPLGEHGLLAAGRSDRADYDEVTLDVARTLAEHTTTALDRVERATEVRESERRFRMIAERIDQVIFLATPDFSEVFYVNDAYEEIWGQPVRELLEDPRGFIEYVDPRDREEFETEFEEMIAEIERGEPRDSYEFEFRVRRPDGEIRWVRATGYPAGFESGDRRFVGIVEDVTERRELERTYRAVFENVSDGLVVHDPETGEIVDVNEQYCSITGYSREELVGGNIRLIVPDEPGDTFEDALSRIERAREEGPQLFEFRGERKDGATFVGEVHLSTVDIRGEERVLASVRDVTERRELERTYRAVFENVSDGLVVHDPETGEIVDVNDRYCEMNGYDRAELVGSDVGVVTAPGEEYSYEAAEELIERAREEGPQLFEWQNQRSDGETFPVEVHLSVVDIRGEERVLASVRDVTERKRREREYEQIFDGVQDAIAVFHPETGEIVDVNDTYHEMLGYDDLETIRELGIEGLSVAEEGYTGERGRELISEVARTGEPRTVEWRGERNDGEWLWLEATLATAEIGGEKRVLSMQRDITERKRREREYEQIFNGVNDIVNVYDPETKELIQVNDTMCELTGYDRETILERGLDAVSATDEGYDSERASAVIDEAMETGEPQELEWRLETADGDRRWLEVNATPATINGEDRLVTISRDVTERKRREREYEQIFDGVTDAITVHDPDTGEILDVNETTCELTGYDRETLLDDGMERLNVGSEGYSSERAREIIREVMETGEPRTLEWLIERADGDRRWLEVNATPATLNGEERYLAIMRDVTDQRRTERRLRAILDRIDEAIFLTRAAEITQASQEPDYLSSGYEEIWGQPLEDIRDRYEDGFFGTLHPEDEPDYRAFVERIVADVGDGDAADSYTTEYRIERPGGEVRWVRSDYYPIEWDSGPPRIVIVSRDVTDRKERERRIASFEEATDDLATADDPEEAAGLAVRAATEDLGLSAVGVFLYDETDGVLEPEACSDALPGTVGGRAVGPGDGPLWEAFATGGVADPDSGVESGTVEPPVGDAADLADWRAITLGNHGVLLVGSTDDSIDPEALQAAHILAATLEAALNHLRGQQRLAVQEEQLKTQTERAERLDRIVRLTQQVEAAINEASDPSEVERAVCERLAGTGPYEAAWIGGVEVGTDRIEPQSVVGASMGYVDGLDLTTADGSPDPHPAVRAWGADEPAVAESLVDGGPGRDWRRRALAAGHQSLCAVPLTYDGITHGVLTVAAGSPHAFGDRERDVLAQLGTSIGYALAAIERRRALESDETVELEFGGPGTDLRFARAASEADCEVRHERTVPRDGGDVSVYFTFDGGSDTAATVAEETLPGDVDVVADGSDSLLVEAVTDDWFGSPLAEYGAVLREASATPDRATIVVELSAGADVRSFTERLEDLAPSLELVAKRQHQRRERTAEELRSQVQADLTDRQYEVLTTALSAGYFEWPRESDGGDVAERLGITQPTFNKHLRLGERKTFELLFGEG